MSNALLVSPSGSGLGFDYRPVIRKNKSHKESWIGFTCSLSAHLGLLLIGGLMLVKPVEFGIDLDPSGMEVQLVAGAIEPVKETPIVEETPIIQEIKEVIIPEPVKEIVKPLPVPEPEKKITNSQITASSTSGAQTEIKPSYLRNPAPQYPYEARKNGWEGVVLLKVFVDKKGSPQKVELESSSGHNVLDQAALKTVKAWQFRPAKLGSIAIESSLRVPIRFELKS